MKITEMPKWLAIAVIVLVLAIPIYYFARIYRHSSPREQACERAAKAHQPSERDKTLEGISVDEAICNGSYSR